jgi:hypothetical protein
MLRRYLIVNGVSSAVMYVGIWAFVPSLSSVTEVINASWETYVLGHTFLAPVIHRVITVGASLTGII